MKISLLTAKGLEAFELLIQVFHVIRSAYAGVLLGLFSSTTLRGLTEAHYKNKKSLFQRAAFQRRGLFLWEEAIIDTYFLDCTNLLILGAGAGREVFGLLSYPFEITAMEPNAALCQKGNDLLSSEGSTVRIQEMRDDAPPELSDTYDGVIIGWGAYMHITERADRVALLEALAAATSEQAPVLISVEPPHKLHPLEIPIAYTIGNVLRKIRRLPPLQLGDYIMIREGYPAFVHLFQADQLRRELRDAGYKTVYYDEADYCVCVASRADEDPEE